MGGRMTSADALQILSLGSAPSPAEIRRAYRKLAFVWHPDRHAQNPHRRQQAEEKFKTINAAYRRLKEFGPSDARDPEPRCPTPRHSSPGYCTSSSRRPQAESREGSRGSEVSWATAASWLSLVLFLLSLASGPKDNSPRLTSPPPIPEISETRPAGQ